MERRQRHYFIIFNNAARQSRLRAEGLQEEDVPTLLQMYREVQTNLDNLITTVSFQVNELRVLYPAGSVPVREATEAKQKEVLKKMEQQKTARRRFAMGLSPQKKPRGDNWVKTHRELFERMCPGKAWYCHQDGDDVPEAYDGNAFFLGKAPRDRNIITMLDQVVPPETLKAECIVDLCATDMFISCVTACVRHCELLCAVSLASWFHTSTTESAHAARLRLLPMPGARTPAGI
jgi:hypothetical protein